MVSAFPPPPEQRGIVSFYSEEHIDGLIQSHSCCSCLSGCCGAVSSPLMSDLRDLRLLFGSAPYPQHPRVLPERLSQFKCNLTLALNDL